MTLLAELIEYLRSHPTAAVRVQRYGDGTRDMIVRVDPEPLDTLSEVFTTRFGPRGHGVRAGLCERCTTWATLYPSGLCGACEPFF